MKVSIVGIIILVIIALFFIRGWKNGLIKSVFDLFSFFIVGILTWLLYPSLTSILMDTPLYDAINKWILSGVDKSDFFEKTLPDFFSDLPAFMRESALAGAETTLQSSVASIAEALTVLAVNVISIIALFITLSIIAFFIKKLGTFINKIVIVGAVNRVLGGAFGLVQGLFICYIAIMLISYFPTTSVYDYVAKDIEQSYVCKLMYNDDVSILGFKPTYPVVRGD